MKQVIFWTLLVVLVFFSSSSQANLCSTFDLGTEGWDSLALTPGEVSDLSWHSSGGHPGGHVGATDLGNTPGGALWTFQSPGTWSGDFTRYIGGTVRFDLKIQEAGNLSYNASRLILALDLLDSADQNFLGWFSSDNQPPVNEWVHYRTRISSSNFQVMGDDVAGMSFEESIRNVTGVYVRGDYLNGVDDQAFLDNVSISAVPEPTTLLLVGTGLIGLAAVAGRRNRFKAHS